MSIQKPSLLSIVNIRTQIATELRKYKSGGSTTQATVTALMRQYGQLDGTIIYNYATNFSAVNKTLTVTQQAQLTALRIQLLSSLSLPTTAYLYAAPISYPTVQNTDFLFK